MGLGLGPPTPEGGGAGGRGLRRGDPHDPAVRFAIEAEPLTCSLALPHPAPAVRVAFTVSNAANPLQPPLTDDAVRVLLARPPVGGGGGGGEVGGSPGAFFFVCRACSDPWGGVRGLGGSAALAAPLSADCTHDTVQLGCVRLPAGWQGRGWEQGVF